MQNRMIRTDLAQEAFAYRPDAPGVKSVQETAAENIEITRVQILDENGAVALSKPIGQYITIDAPDLLKHDVDYEEKVTEVIAQELIKLMGKLNEKDTILIIGLGNQKITPDALGPKVAERVLVSRHVTEYLPDAVNENVRPVCAIAPGVLGMTGIETGEVVYGIAQVIKPRMIVVIDALASRSTDRISTAIQMTDTGIRPGSGLGNRRMEISQETMGATVIAIGVPTVVHASTISQDAVEMLLDEMGEQDQQGLIELVGKIVSERIGPLVVTPKDIDQIINDTSRILANALDIALHAVSLGEIRRLLH